MYGMYATTFALIVRTVGLMTVRSVYFQHSDRQRYQSEEKKKEATYIYACMVGKRVTIT